MNSAKRENLLNLALDATEREREKSLELDVGYSKEEDTWDVIVKYSGDIASISRDYPQISIVVLSNEYAIVTLPQPLMDVLTDRIEIEYIEKPKRLFFSVTQGIRSSCILPVYRPPFFLSGRGVLVAVIDSGIDYLHPDFRNPDGSTRIAALWDQTIPGNGSTRMPPEGFLLGTEFSQAQINEALAQPERARSYSLVPSYDTSGHGTHVTGIAAGNGRASDGQNRGVAYESPLLIVKLGTPRTESFPRTTELMQAVDYVIRKARALALPAAINISFGNNYGSHDGTSLLETYLSDIASYWKTVIVTGTGNEGNARGHTAGQLASFKNTMTELLVGTYETSLNLQIWKSYVDEFGIRITHPNGKTVGTIQQIQGTQRFSIEGTELLVYYGEPSPYSPYQEIYIDFLPRTDYIDSGVWGIELIPQRIVYGEYNMWIPSAAVLNAATGFLLPSEHTTLTIPSTAAKVISVGAYDAYYDQYAPFSGRGYTRQTNQIKPDISAPGVDIISAAPGGGYETRDGTSMAAPFVTGAAALLMQWGIVDGNDPYLYGEKVKAYLIRGARHLPGFETWPNPQLGWGALCVKDSLPV